MTSTTGAAGHPDVDEISALAEGLLSASEASDVRRHLDTCEDCSATHAALEEIRELLGAPEPLTMPMDVAERIDAALAAEALKATSATSSPEADSSASLDAAAFPHSSESSARSRVSEPVDHRSGQPVVAHVSRETSPMGPSGTPADRPVGRPRGSTRPGRTGRGRLGQRRGFITLGAVFTTVAIGLGTVLLQTMTENSSGSTTRTTPPSDARPAVSSKTLEGEVTTLLADQPAPLETHASAGAATSKPSIEMGSPNVTPSPTSPATKSATPLQRPRIEAMAMPNCVRQGIGRSEAPIAVERAIFEGTDAYLVVLPHATDRRMVSAYVVDASCVHGPANPLGTVLLTRSYLRR